METVAHALNRLFTWHGCVVYGLYVSKQFCHDV